MRLSKLLKFLMKMLQKNKTDLQNITYVSEAFCKYKWIQKGFY